ncbi:hypothetical protein Ciccas_010332, partial [Cichlidogyrus casuarinus]
MQSENCNNLAKTPEDSKQVAATSQLEPKEENLMQQGNKIFEYIDNYRKNIRNLRVCPDVVPGFMSQQIPEDPPVKAETLDDIMRDVTDKILPGLVHWTSPYMHAYFPAQTSTPSILAEALSAAINSICFTWASSPSGTELEMIVMDWLARMIDLPDKFIHANTSTSGGGTILTTCSEATLNSMMAARKRAIDQLRVMNMDECYHESDTVINAKLVAYVSEMAHSSLKKNAQICMFRLQALPVDETTGGLRGATLLRQMYKDISLGLVPFYVCATLGTTGCCTFDHLDEICDT